MVLEARVISIVLVVTGLLQSHGGVSGLHGHGSYVMNLDDRFEGTRGEDPYLVEFYAPWCGHCKKLEPVYERAAAELDGTGIYVAKVDATLYRDIASNYEVHGFPTIKYIQGSKVVDYRGDRTAEDIRRFAVRCRSEPIQPLYSVGGLRDRLRQNSDDAFFVYIGEENHRLYSEFKRAAGNYSVYIDFYKADYKGLKQELDDPTDLPIVLVYKDGSKYKFEIMQDASLEHWVNEERYTAMQPAKGAVFHDLMSMDKMLILIVAQPASADKVIRENSKRAIERAKPTALDRNLKQFQFVVMDKTSVISNIVLGQVSAPYAVALHPITYTYYITDKPVEEMSTQDWINFLTGITTGRLQEKGGKGFIMQMRRALYGLMTSILELWEESRLLFGVVVVLPTFVIGIVVYTVCCITWDGEEGDQEEVSDSEDEVEPGQSPQSDKDTGHYKTE